MLVDRWQPNFESLTASDGKTRQLLRPAAPVLRHEVQLGLLLAFVGVTEQLEGVVDVLGLLDLDDPLVAPLV